LPAQWLKLKPGIPFCSQTYKFIIEKGDYAYQKNVIANHVPESCSQNFFGAYLLRASFYDETGEYEKAVTDLVKAKKLDSGRQESIDSRIERIKEKIRKQ